jgi:hypothetical protein
MHKHGPAPKKEYPFVWLQRKTWKRKEKCKIQQNCLIMIILAEFLFSQAPHADK